MPKAPKFWHKPTLVSRLLWPLTLLYRAGYNIHQFIRSSAAFRPPVKVISVGNLVAGGAGKTPIVEHLARFLVGQGYQVAILSRGYGGRLSRPYRVTDADTARDVGDEPLMLFEALKGLPIHIWVGQDRKALAKRAVTAGAMVLILDDGFQTTQIERDIEIVVVDGSTGFGNGFLLPAGPLRSPLSELKRADVIVCYGERLASLPPSTLSLSLMTKTDDILALHGKRLLAFCGLGNPDKFFLTLRRGGGHVVGTESFPDHHNYSVAEQVELQNRAASLSAELVTTHKDAVKLLPNIAKVLRAELAGDVSQLEQRVLDMLK